MNGYPSYSNVLLFIIMVCGIGQGCSSPDGADSVDDHHQWDISITVRLRDEFFRFVPSNGPFTLTLSSSHGRVKATIPVNDSTHTFSNIEGKSFLISAERDGYDPFTLPYQISDYYYGYPTVNATLYLFPPPTPMMRIDSLVPQLNTITPRVQLHIFFAQQLPADGTRSIVVFISLQPNVSSLFQTYIYTFDGINQEPGTSEALTTDLFRQLREINIPQGTTVYATARIRVGNSITSVDQQTGITVYSNLENNTRYVASFVMP